MDANTEVGHLLRHPVLIDCPSCHHRGVSRLVEDVVTVPQMISFCINKLFCGYTVVCWDGRFDYNHYCSACGCYIGRHFNFDRRMRSMMEKQRLNIEEKHRVEEAYQQAQDTPANQKNGSNIGPAAITPLAPIAKQ